MDKISSKQALIACAAIFKLLIFGANFRLFSEVKTYFSTWFLAFRFLSLII